MLVFLDLHRMWWTCKFLFPQIFQFSELTKELCLVQQEVEGPHHCKVLPKVSPGNRCAQTAGRQGILLLIAPPWYQPLQVLVLAEQAHRMVFSGATLPLFPFKRSIYAYLWITDIYVLALLFLVNEKFYLVKVVYSIQVWFC